MSGSEGDHHRETTSALNALLAAWLIVSPWLFGTPSRSFAMPSIDFAVNTVGIGSLVLAVSAIRLQLGGTAGFGLLSANLGAWLIISPWMFGYDANDLQTWNCMLVGAVIAGVAAFDLASRVIRRRSWGLRDSSSGRSKRAIR
jgi:SPW repeat